MSRHDDIYAEITFGSILTLLIMLEKFKVGSDDVYNIGDWQIEQFMVRMSKYR